MELRRKLHVLGLALCLLFGLLGPYSALAAPPSLSDFLQPESTADAAISPDGNRVARLEYVDGRSRIEISPFSGSAGAVSSAFKLSDTRAISVNWANNDRLVIGIIVWNSVLNVVNLPYIRVVAINPDGTNPVVLFNDSRQFSFNANLSNLIHTLPGKPNDVLMAAVGGDGALGVFRVNVQTGQTQLEEAGTPDTVGWSTDRAGKVVLRIDENQPTGLRRIYARGQTGDTWEKIAEYPSNRAPDMRVLGSSADPKIFLVRTNYRNDKSGIHLYDLQRNKIVGTLYQRNDYDAETAVSVDFVSDPVAAFYLGIKPELDFFNPQHRTKITQVLSRLHPSTSISDMVMDADKRRWIIETQGPLDPGTFYKLDLETLNFTPLGKRRPALSSRSLAHTSAFTYSASDGLEIPAYLTIPAGSIAQNLPLVVMPHGGPEARDVMIFDPLAQFIASRGYAVFQPNFRGSDGFGRKFAQKGYGEWGGLMQSDVIDGLKDLVDRGIANPNRVCIVGGSYGGYVALMASIQTPDRFKCAVSIAGVTDLPDTIETVKRDFGANSPAYAYVRRAIGRWPEQSQKLIARSPARNAEKVKLPVLIIHGVHDDVVPIAQAIKMRDALIWKNKPVSYLQLNRSDHHNTHPADLQQMLATLDLFLRRHLDAQMSELDPAAATLSLTSKGYSELHGEREQMLSAEDLEELHKLPLHMDTFSSRPPNFR